MHLGYLTVAGRGSTDSCIAGVVERAKTNGLRVAGTVRASPVDPCAHPCDMDLRVLPDGPSFRISQPLGSGSRGCRLDGGEIERVAAAVQARLVLADVLIVNKFGKQEALGRGLCPAIIRAIELGLPVLVGVNALNLSDFQRFAGGVAVEVEANPEAAFGWFTVARSRSGLAAEERLRDRQTSAG